MSHDHTTHRPRASLSDWLTVDWLTVVIVGLLVAVQLAATAMVAVPDTGPNGPSAGQPAPATGAEGVVGAAGLLFIWIIEGIALLGLYAGFQRLPERVQSILSTWGVHLAVAVFATSLGVWAAVQGYVETGAILTGAIVASWAIGYGIVRLVSALLERFDLKWLLFNAVGLALGTLAAVSLGQLFGPLPLLLLLLALTVYDHVAVNLSDYMSNLVAVAVNWQLPLMVIVPRSVRFDLDRLEGLLDRDSDERTVTIIGVGDLALPATLGVMATAAGDAPAVVGHLSLPAAGALLGTAVGGVAVRAAMEHSDMSPGLPWLNYPTIAGYLAGAVVAGIPLSVATGVML